MVAVAGTIMILGGVGAIVINQTLLPKLATNSVAKNWSWVKQSAERTTIVNKTEEIVVRPDNAMRTTVSNVRPTVVQIVPQNSDVNIAKTAPVQTGTGVILSSDGIVAGLLANSETLKKDASFAILANSGKQYEAVLEAIDDLTGIVFLRINDVDNLPVVTFMRDEDIFLTQSVVALRAIGTKFTRAALGSVTDIDYDGELSFTKSLLTDKLASSVRIDLGVGAQIGDTIFNSRSEFVGLLADSNSGQIMSVGVISDAWQRLLAGKLSKQISLGVEYILLSPAVLTVRDFAQNDVQKGVLVTNVVKGSAAARAKLYKGDIIVKVDDVMVDSVQLAWILRNYQPGDVLRLEILRSGGSKQLLVSL